MKKMIALILTFILVLGVYALGYPQNNLDIQYKDDIRGNEAIKYKSTKENKLDITHQIKEVIEIKEDINSNIQSNSIKPDLRLYDLGVEPGCSYPFAARKDAVLQYTVANFKNCDCKDVEVGVKIDGELFHTFNIGDIPAHRGYITTFTIGNYREGTYNVEIIADINNIIEEEDETNNSDSGNFTWIGTPDLVAAEWRDEGLSVYEKDKKYDFYFRVDNAGTGVAKGETIVYLINNGDTVAQWSFIDFPENAYFEKDITLRFRDEGDYNIGIVVDKENKISESNENNNSIIKKYTAVESYGTMGWEYMYNNPNNRYISSGYGLPDRPDHYGIDIISSNSSVDHIYGDPIENVCPGTVELATESPTAGNYVVVKSDNIDPITGNNLRVRYLHMKGTPIPRQGDIVSKGSLVGYTGNTGYVEPLPTPSNPKGGTHLHFDVNNKAKTGYLTINDTINPELFFPLITFSGKTSL